MNIDELTLGQLKEIQSMTSGKSSSSEYDKYIGKRPTIYAMNYIYTGEVVRVEGGSIILDNAMIVYNTGSHESPDWSDAEKMPNGWSVTIQSIESHGIFKTLEG